MYFPIQKFINTYRVFLQKDLQGKPSKNIHDTYLITKNKNYIYRYSKTTLAILFTSTNSKNIYLPLLEKENIKLKEFISSDMESIYHFTESDLSKLATIMKIQKMHKSIFPNFE